MSDLENPNTNPVPDEFDQFLSGMEEHETLFNPEQAVSIRSTNGGSFEVPADEPMTIADALGRAGLTVGANMEYWVNGTQVGSDFMVGPGATVTAVGQVKGG